MALMRMAKESKDHIQMEIFKILPQKLVNNFLLLPHGAKATINYFNNSNGGTLMEIFSSQTLSHIRQ